MKNKVSFCFVHFSRQDFSVYPCPVELALVTWPASDSDICRPLPSMLVLNVRAATHHQALGSFAGTPCLCPQVSIQSSSSEWVSVFSPVKWGQPTIPMITAGRYSVCHLHWRLPLPTRWDQTSEAPVRSLSSSAAGKTAHLIRAFACHAQVGGFNSYPCLN